MMAKQEDENQTDDEQGQNDIGLLIISRQDVVVRTDECQAPHRAGYSLIGDEAVHTFKVEEHIASIALSHFVPQSNENGLLAW